VTTYVWDTTLLLHACAAERDDVLGSLVPTGRHVITDIVADELRTARPTWIDIVDTPTTATYMSLLASWRQRCGAGDGRNEGEASVLAYVDHHRDDDIAVIDDGSARAVGARHLGKERVHGSLWMLCEGIKEDPGRRTSAARFCDTILSNPMHRPGPIRWPFNLGGFDRWAVEYDLLPAG